MNRSDSERISGVLEDMGYTPSDDENDPDVVIKGIVACSVRQKAIDRVYGRIRNWNRSKSVRPAISFVTGCILEADRDKFLKLFDLVFPVTQLTELPDMIRQYGVPVPSGKSGDLDGTLDGADALDGEEVLSPELKRMLPFWNLTPLYSSEAEAFVPIQNGCNKFCSFCAVPYTRGREVSRPSSDILKEVEALVEGGCKAITLLGQNVNSYGLDRPDSELSFPGLMRKVGELGKRSGREFLVYFTSPHPRDITVELLEVMAEYPVLAKWVHLPLQSGDDAVLKRMNRRHSMERYRKVVADFRRILPDAALFTDIIVGFSGETELQFQSTLEAMREFRYDMAYIARYSPRPGAASSRWEDDVPPAEKERRFRILSEVLQQEAEPHNRSKVGKVFRVLLTAPARRKGWLSGYTEGRIPVYVQADPSYLGQFVNVKITSARPLSVEGTLAGPAAKAGKAALKAAGTDSTGPRGGTGQSSGTGQNTAGKAALEAAGTDSTGPRSTGQSAAGKAALEVAGTDSTAGLPGVPGRPAVCGEL